MRRFGSLFVVAVALASSCGLAGAASRTASVASISAHLTKTTFQSSQARSVKVVYRFSASSRHFSYLLTLKKGAKWQTVKSVKKTGSFRGSQSMTVKKVFAGKPIKIGRYRLKLSPDKGSKLLGFSVVKTVPGLVPTSFFLPEISGTAKQGQTLTIWRGTWRNAPTSYAYQWRRCDISGTHCSSIAGASSPKHVLVYADAGSTIRVVVTAKNSHGSGSATSSRTVVVTGLPPVNTNPPAISGNAAPGQTLTATNGAWNNSPTAYAFQWRQCKSSDDCLDIQGATSSTFVLRDVDNNCTIRVVVTASNPYGAASETSSQTATISNLPPANNGTLPQISGNATEGQTLSTTDGGWNNSPSSITYQWQHCDTSGANCTDISSATAVSYTLVSGDKNYTIRVVVTASNTNGSAIATSNQTPVVAAP